MSLLALATQFSAKFNVPMKYGEFRRYEARMTSSTVIGNVDVSVARTVYKVGFAGGSVDPAMPTIEKSRALAADMIAKDPKAYNNDTKKRELLRRLRAGVNAKAAEQAAHRGDAVPVNPCMVSSRGENGGIAQTYAVASGLAADMAGIAKKWTSAAGDYKFADLSALTERLAMGMAFYSFTGHLSMEELAGGHDIVLVPVSAGPATYVAPTNSVWITRSSSGMNEPNVMSALVAACAGVGSLAVTDLVAVDGDNRALIPVSEDSALVEGIHDALRIIGSNMAHSSAGSLFTYALTRGIHRVATVVGMTDEGAFMRDVLRAEGFQPSFGPISCSYDDWTAMPRCNGPNVRSWASLVDNIALSTAALVACCDPCMNFGGRMYPTVYTTTRDNPVNGGVASQGNMDDAKTIGNKMCANNTHFLTNFSRALCEVFSVRVDDYVDSVVKHMHVAFVTATRGNRHLMHACVSPYYWIEPTGIIDYDVSTLTATQQGYGPLCYPSRDVTCPLLPDCEYYMTAGDLGEVNCEWRSARTVPLLMHLRNSELDGLANGWITMADPDNFVNLGGRDKDVRRRMAERDDLSTYMWNRSDVGIPAPGEAMYLGVGVGLTVRHSFTDESSFRTRINHFPSAAECKGQITFSTTRLSPIETGGLGPDRHAVRGFTKALAALDIARWQGGSQRGRVIGTISYYDAMRGPKGYPPHIAVPLPAGSAPQRGPAHTLKGDPLRDNTHPQPAPAQVVTNLVVASTHRPPLPTNRAPLSSSGDMVGSHTPAPPVLAPDVEPAAGD
jgi:hypothetical protein